MTRQQAPVLGLHDTRQHPKAQNEEARRPWPLDEMFVSIGGRRI